MQKTFENTTLTLTATNPNEIGLLKALSLVVVGAEAPPEPPIEVELGARGLHIQQGAARLVLLPDVASSHFLADFAKVVKGERPERPIYVGSASDAELVLFQDE